MDTFLKDKKFNTIVFILLLVVSLFFIAKFVNEVKQSNYIGRGNQPANTISVSEKVRLLQFQILLLYLFP